MYTLRFWVTSYEFLQLSYPDCQRPVNPPNGAYFFTLTTYTAVATLTCDAGHVTTLATVTCNSTGSWSDSPSCEPIGNKTVFLKQDIA